MTTVTSGDAGAAGRLVATSTAAAEVMEFHKTTMVDGMMGMAPVAAVEVPAGGQTALEPGGPPHCADWADGGIERGRHD